MNASLPRALTGALLLCGILDVHPTFADTYTKYNVVADNVPARGGFTNGGTGICPVAGITVDPNATSTRIYYTAYDIPGASRSSALRYYTDTTGRWYPSSGVPGLNSTPLIESDYSLSYSHGKTPVGGSPFNVGIGCNVNPLGTQGNAYLRVGEVRYVYFGVTYNGPTELIYSNVVDGNLYTDSLPGATDVATNVSGVGFSGFATPKNPGFGLNYVYLSLQNPSGLYWNGTDWGNERIKFRANTRIVNSTTGRVQWSKIGGWPTGGKLSAGSYTLRTIAVEGQIGYGPGIQNQITFSVIKSGSPRSVNPSAKTG